jgi:hypothetical protein
MICGALRRPSRKLEAANNNAPNAIPAVFSTIILMLDARTVLTGDPFDDLFNPNLPGMVATGKASKPNAESLIQSG